MPQPVLPPPNLLLGVPDSDGFASWYQNQDKVVSQILKWLMAPEPKFMCASLPTGSGKSLIAALSSVLFNRRAVVLTATKGLQDQFLSDFKPTGFEDMRGQNAYLCNDMPDSGITVDRAACHAGYRCSLMRGGCAYYDRLSIAGKSPLVVTNYAYWLAQQALVQGPGLGLRDFMVMDEADQAFSALESFLTTHISLEECRQAGVVMPHESVRPETWSDWRAWAHEHLPAVWSLETNLKAAMEYFELEIVDALTAQLTDREHILIDRVRKLWALTASNRPGEAAAARVKARELMESYGITEESGQYTIKSKTTGDQLIRIRWTKATADEIEHIRVVHGMVQKLEQIRGGVGEWVWQTTDGRRRGGGFGMLFTPVWPGEYARLIYGKAKKVLIMSATLTPKTADLLGIKESSRTWLEVGSGYPPAHTPIRHVSTIRVDYKATDVDMRSWVSRMDQIIERRQDRKGLILPVSYRRGQIVLQNSRFAEYMVTHSAGGVVQAVEKWRRSKAPSILVSPSIARGWDFPGDECRYIIIGKIPFADSTSTVAKARQASDKGFAGFEAMQTLVQEAGRGTRNQSDWCEVFILDDNWSWFYNRNHQFAPQFFKDRLLRRSDVVPPALEV